MAARANVGLLALVVMGGTFAVNGAGCTCSKGGDAGGGDGSASSGSSGSSGASGAPGAGAGQGGAAAHDGATEAGGLSAPIAAARGERGEVVVAGLDVPARAIRVQRISAHDEVLADRTVLPGVAWSSESEMKLVPAAGGVAMTWRGLRGGKLVRQLLVLGPDLAPKGEPVDIAAASCATHDAVWFTDGKYVHSRPWTGSPTRSDLPKDKDAALVCGATRAFALLDGEEGTSLVVFGAGDAGAGVGRAAPASASATSTSIALLKESDFGDDEQRERAEFAVGDDVGVVRLATSGSLTLREVRNDAPGPLRKLKTIIPRDDDVVAVDASPRAIVIVFTEDVGEGCGKQGGSPVSASTRVKALRVDRTTFEESTVELSPGGCGRELGPFITGVLGDAVSVSWVERVPVAGKSRAPIAGLVHRTVSPAGPLAALARIEQPADALVDAGCDGARCYAVALARREGMDAMVSGLARILRY